MLASKSTKSSFDYDIISLYSSQKSIEVVMYQKHNK